jgi:hypothetical protein
MTADVNPTVLETILTHLALLFLTAAAGDPAAARAAAAQALAAYHAQTEEELRLASEILSFSLHALEALGQAADRELSLNRIVRLRGSAVSLSREAHKAQRRLDQLQRARTAATQPQPQLPEPQTDAQAAQPAVSDEISHAIAEAERIAKQMMGKHGGMTWTQSYQKRILTQRMAENAKKNQAKYAAQLAQAIPEAAHAIA